MSPVQTHEPLEDNEASARVRAAYDTVARAYYEQLGGELAGKPLDRGLLTSFAELTASGTIADLGCGPGHVTRFLAEQHSDVIGVDLSPGMIAIARESAPDLRFTVGSMLRLPAADGAWAGAIALYSIIHLSDSERTAAFSEFARVLRCEGWLLTAFHIDSAEFAAGQVSHRTDWFGQSVDLDGYFLEPAQVLREIEAAGFTIMSTVIRQPWPAVEYPSRRCYLLAQRH